jgi:FkbM family methyltransferase
MEKNILKIFRRFILFISGLSLNFSPSYLLTRLLKGRCVVLVNGFKMELDLKKDVGISRDLFLFRKREHLSTDYVLKNNVFKENSTIIDIGANIGYYALLESGAVKDGSVFAIEPVSKNFKNLERNIFLNSIKNIKTFHLAIGDKNEFTEINVGEKGNFSSFLKNENAVYESKEKVEMMTLDSFVQIHQITPSLIRMDVEGYETKIVEGMSLVLSRMKPALLIEIHPHLIQREDMDKMIETFIANNYTEVVVIKERKDVWMKRNGDIKPILKFISRIIEKDKYTMGTGSVEKISIHEMRQRVKTQHTAFHALIT